MIIVYYIVEDIGKNVLRKLNINFFIAEFDESYKILIT